MRIITFKLDEDLLQKLDRYAMNHRLYRAEVIRMALEEFLKNHGMK